MELLLNKKMLMNITLKKVDNIFGCIKVNDYICKARL